MFDFIQSGDLFDIKVNLYILFINYSIIYIFNLN